MSKLKSSLDLSELQRQQALNAEGGRGYDAFLCYSYKHDQVLAPALQAAIEAMVRPLPFVRRLRVFRDVTDLEATPHLWGSIQRELARSRYLILLASPDAVASRWVPRELEEFLRHHPVEQILVVLTSGTTSFLPREQGAQAVPALLEEAFQRAGAEPLVLDLRELRELDARGMRESPKLAEVAARLSARLLGLPLSELWGVHRQLRRRWNLIIGAVAATLLAMLTVSVWGELKNRALVATEKFLEVELGRLAEQQRRLARDNAKVAEDALVTALEAAKPYLAEKALPTEVRDRLAAGIAAAADLRVLGHLEERARVLALCPQWDTAVTWHPQHGLKKWSLSTGESALLWARHEDPPEEVKCAAKAPIAVIHGDSPHPWVETWDLLQGRRIARMEGELWARLSDSALSPDGTVVASVLLDGMVYIWESSTGKRLRRFRQPERNGWKLMFSPAGDLLLVGSNPKQGQVTVWDYRTGAIRATLKGQLDSNAAAQWSPDGKQLLLTGERRVTIAALDGTIVQKLPEREHGIWQVVFDPKAKRILIAAQDGRAAVLDRATGQEKPRLTGHAGSVLAAAFSQDGSYAATVGRDHTLRLWDTGTGELLKIFWHGEPLKNVVAFTSDGGALVTATEKGMIHVWSISTGLFVGTRNGSCPATSDFAKRLYVVVPDQSRYALLMCQQSDKLHLVDVETGREEDVIEWQSPRGMADAALSPDGRRLLLGGNLGDVFWFDRDARRWTFMSVEDFAPVTQVAWAPSGRRFASATPLGHPYGTAVVIWDTDQRVRIARFFVDGVATSLRFDKTGKQLLVGSENRPPEVWVLSDTGAVFLNTGLMDTFELPSRSLFQIQCDEYGDQLIVEDSNTGVPLARFPSEPAVQGGVRDEQGLYRTPYGTFIVEKDKALLVHGSDGWLRKWLLPEPLPSGDLALLRRACERLSSVSRARVPQECDRVALTAEHR